LFDLVSITFRLKHSKCGINMISYFIACLMIGVVDMQMRDDGVGVIINIHVTSLFGALPTPESTRLV